MVSLRLDKNFDGPGGLDETYPAFRIKYASKGQRTSSSKLQEEQCWSRESPMYTGPLIKHGVLENSPFIDDFPSHEFLEA